MLKVCMVVHSVSTDNRVRRYADCLVETGAQVDILCLQDVEPNFLLQNNGVRVFTIKVSHQRRSPAYYFIDYCISFLLFSVRLIQLYLRNHYQIIHIHNVPDFLVFTALVPKLLGAKIILDIHDLMPELFMSKYFCDIHNPIVRLSLVQEKISAKFADAILVATKTFKNNLIHRGIIAKKITIFDNIADPRYFDRKRFLSSAKHDPNQFILIYTGTLVPRYGLEIALQAIKLLIPEIPGIRLSIFGMSNSYRDKLINLTKELDISNYVQFNTAVPPGRLALELMQADVGIYTAIRDSHMDIAMPTKVLEYAAMGIPIISSHVKVLEDVFPESTILFFESGNVEQFAGCVKYLFHQPELGRELVGKMDKIYFKTFSWDTERQRYFDLLNNLLIPSETKKKFSDGSESNTDML